MKKSFVLKPLPFLAQLALSLGLGTLVGVLTRPGEQFQMLNKPPLVPPSVVFIIAWSVFYTLMAVSAYLVRLKPNRDDRALKLYYLQLAVNFLWPVLFFKFNLLTVSFIWILLLIGLVGTMILFFYKENRLAAFLQLPYLAWLLFAAYLNLGYVVLN